MYNERKEGRGKEEKVAEDIRALYKEEKKPTSVTSNSIVFTKFHAGS